MGLALSTQFKDKYYKGSTVKCATDKAAQQNDKPNTKQSTELKTFQ